MRSKVARKGATPTGQRPAPAPEEKIREALALLDARRRAAGHSQAALARALGVGPSAISRLFAGQYGVRGAAASLATEEGVRRIELALRLLVSGGRQTEKEAVANAARAAVVDTEIRRDRALDAGPAWQGVWTVNRADPYRVLIAEDEADILDLYRIVLTDDGEFASEGGPRYSITSTRTVEGCLEELHAAATSQRVIDLLLMDLGLGDPRRGSGEGTLLTYLRARPEELPRRILVVSGVSPYILAQRKADLTALDATFLSKPFNIDTLAAAVAWLCAAELPRMEGLRYFS